jgi:hypothetical protein
MSYKQGDRVRWARVINDRENQGAIGTVVAVILSDGGQDAFNMYEVVFPFGMVTLHGTQIEAEGTKTAGRYD